MPAGKNYNVITKRVRPSTTTGAAVAIGSSVAAGMKRYVTFISVSRVQGDTNVGAKVFICSTSTAAKASTETLASASQKMKIILASAVYKASTSTKAGGPANFSIPSHINTENPLFSIAESRFLTVREASTAALGNAAVSVFVQYYDQ